MSDGNVGPVEAPDHDLKLNGQFEEVVEFSGRPRVRYNMVMGRQ